MNESIDNLTEIDRVLVSKDTNLFHWWEKYSNSSVLGKPVTPIKYHFLSKTFIYKVYVKESFYYMNLNDQISKWISWAEIRKPSFWSIWPEYKSQNLSITRTVVGFTVEEDMLEFALTFV